MFGSNNNAASGGMFGANNTSSGLFGANKPAAPLFGASNTSTSNNASSGLFGSANNSNNAPSAPSGGLFGSSNNNNAPSAPSGGLFGASNNNNTSNTASGGLFGGNNNTNTASGGLFGGNNQAGNTLFSKPKTGGLFGATPATQPTSNNPQQQVQLTAMTRIGDLPPDMKKFLQDFDNYINTQHLIATTLKSDMNKHDQLIKSIPKDTNYLYTKFSSTKQALKFDSNQLSLIKEYNNDLTDDINKIMHLIIQLSTPGTKLSSSFQLNEFFIKKIKKYHEILSNYEQIVKEAEEVITGLERSCVDGFGGLFNIVEVMKAQYNLFMELCDTFAQLNSSINKLS